MIVHAVFLHKKNKKCHNLIMRSQIKESDYFKGICDKEILYKEKGSDKNG